MKEKEIEKRLTSGVKNLGGKAYKWVSPGNNGVPDRIVLAPGGRVAFVETKAPGKTDRASQRYVQDQLAGLGFPVFRSVDSYDKVESVAAWVRRCAEEALDEQLKGW